ncbi:MAG: hypothetical protein QXM68_04395 [Candidatus Aenigmatarchaeota archaeon]|nr:hypothetical protein [Candidatus Aenigmarchaeota archaeon]
MNLIFRYPIESERREIIVSTPRFSFYDQIQVVRIENSQHETEHPKSDNQHQSTLLQRILNYLEKIFY